MKIKEKAILTSVLCVGFILNGHSFYKVVKANDIVTSLNELIKTYVHNGHYVKDTVINLNEEASIELDTIFHAKSMVFERKTYYKDDALWMTNENGKYSYYGTSEDNLTNGVVDMLCETKETIVFKGQGMEEYYYTLKDVVANEEDNWQLIDNVYSSTSSKMIEIFKGFTAPCYLGFNEKTENYIDLTSVEIEETSKGLELRLLADSTNSSLLKEGSNNVFSKATITYNHEKGEEYTVTPANEYENGLLQYQCVLCKQDIEEILDKIDGVEVDTYPSYTNADVITYNGNVYTYGGSSDGWAHRGDDVYCFNTYSNKLYKLNVKLVTGTTSHRAILRGDKVYIFGGVDTKTKYANIQVHDLKNNTLEAVETKLPFGANCFQAGSYNDKAYFVGGSYSIGSTNKIFEFDFNTLQVKELEAKLPTVVFKGGWCQVGQYIYIAGGTNGKRLTSIFRFNMISHKVETMKATLPFELSQIRLAYDQNHTLYMYGGTNEKNELLDNIFVYDIIKDELKDAEISLPFGIANTCVAYVNNKVYIIGGDNAFSDIIWVHDGNEIQKIF